MNRDMVFYDRTGRRRRWLTRLGTAFALLSAVVSTLFVLSLLAVPVIPHLPGVHPHLRRALRGSVFHLVNRQARLRRHLLIQERTKLFEEIRKDEQQRRQGTDTPSRTAPVVAAFYTTWQETGLHSLRANADKLTHLLPEWLHLNAHGNGIDWYDWDPANVPHNRDVLQIAYQHGLHVMPVLNNAQQGQFDPARVHRLLHSPSAQQSLAVQLRDWLLQQGFQGVNVDFENLYPQDYARYTRWLRRLAHILRASGLELSADIEAGVAPQIWREISQVCDWVVLMVYDEHFASGTSGPVASLPWSRRVLLQAVRYIPREKLVMGIGNYAYDWRVNSSSAETLTFHEAILRARDNRPDDSPQRVVDFDPLALNPTFTYTDEEGYAHEVWLLDAVAVANQWLIGSQMRLRGAALWVLGSEDPSIWSFLRRNRINSRPDMQALREISYPYDVEFIGQGEVLSVSTLPQAGNRRIEVDPRTSLCVDEEYVRFPSTFTIERRGYHAKWLALTFDDGPSDPYTEQILDVLRRFGVRATFFVIGENAEHHPGLLRRMWQEGHEIGSHTFTHPNMAAISTRRARLELNATQRVLQSVLGRTTLLFRPPYNADAEPTSAEEVRPILLASQMSYLTIGELIDPQDWNLRVVQPGGSIHHRTAQEIAQDVIQQALRGTGNVILLHDGGGDRSQTVAALSIIIPYLQQKGYRFVTASQLIGSTRDTVMPPVSGRDLMLVGVDRVVFEVNYVVSVLLSVAFLMAIALTFLRAISVLPFAIIAAARERKRQPPASYQPTVSVMIAAYNERQVIGRTVQAVLNSHYQPLEVIVVDDGSQDGTAEEVERLFGHLPNVRVIRQTNQGKAEALNHAIRYATGEILVALDADTLFLPDTISELVQPFADPRVGAVAGNVKVGNRINLLTRLQAIEYIVNQNLDRRAYALLNGVTVVPGAAGAWRREAVVQAGGYQKDTMAEDMDLTWRLRRAGWRIAVANRAIALTEAPETLKGLFRQRFRWAYGTLQCLWKHRDAIGRYAWFGWLVLPSLWLFQVAFQMLSPLVDAQIAWTVANVGQAWLSRGMLRQDWQPLPQATATLAQIGFMYAVFLAVELVIGIVAFRLDRERCRLLWWFFWQRFVYRQLMYLVMLKSVSTALQGRRTGWSKLERRGSVHLPEP